jgi:hypothetical protein
VLYLYAITESGRLPTIEGLRGASLRAVGRPGLVAVASEHEESSLEPDEADLWSHERVVEQLMDPGPVLPMRFGSTLPGEGAALAFLDDRRQELEQALERVRGAVELSVRVAVSVEAQAEPQGDGDDPPTGASYLLDRLKSENLQHEFTDLVHQPLASLARASTTWSGELRRRQWKAAYLVSSARVDEFAQQVDRLDSELSGAAVICTGPWPPYSFAGGEAER